MLSSQRQIIGVSLVAFALCATISAQIQFDKLDEELITNRLKDFKGSNDEREARLKTWFAEAGCKDENLTEQQGKKQPPNLICTLPGQSDDAIVVGAHFDYVSMGRGVADNWSGASLLPSLYYSLRAQPHQHKYIFIAFTDEEKGLVGSRLYVKELTPEQRVKIKAMINLDTLGLGPSEFWASHADQQLSVALRQVAQAMKLPLSGMNVDGLGTADSESFAQFQIPRITIHSVTGNTLRVLHSAKDQLDVIQVDDYYATYRLVAGYLSYLDGSLAAQSKDKSINQAK